MKVITDSDLLQLVIETIDFNSQLTAICTVYMGKIKDEKNRKKFQKDIERISQDSAKRRKLILGIEP